MDFNAKITLTKSLLSVSECKVADYILTNLEVSSRMSIASLAKSAGVSLPTVTRLAKKLGYEGFTDFRFSLVSEVSEKQIQGEHSMERNEINFDAESHFGRTIRSIIQTAKSVSENDVKEVAARIRKARRVFVIAADSSSSPGMLLTNKFTRLGIDATFVGEAAVIPSIVQHSVKEDVYLIISCSSHSKATIDALKMAENNEAYTIFMSNYMNTQAYELADKVLFGARVEGLRRQDAFCADIALPVLLNMLLEILTDHF